MRPNSVAARRFLNVTDYELYALAAVLSALMRGRIGVLAGGKNSEAAGRPRRLQQFHSYRSSDLQMLCRCLASVGHLFVLDDLPLIEGA